MKIITKAVSLLKSIFRKKISPTMVLQLPTTKINFKDITIQINLIKCDRDLNELKREISILIARHIAKETQDELYEHVIQRKCLDYDEYHIKFKYAIIFDNPELLEAKNV